MNEPNQCIKYRLRRAASLIYDFSTNLIDNHLFLTTCMYFEYCKRDSFKGSGIIKLFLNQINKVWKYPGVASSR